MTNHDEETTFADNNGIIQNGNKEAITCIQKPFRYLFMAKLQKMLAGVNISNVQVEFKKIVRF